MKSIFYLLALCSTIAFCQEEPSAKTIRNNEASLNIGNLLIFKAIDLSYERYLNEESGVGASLLISLGGDKRFSDDGPYYYESFALTGFYKFYFGDRPNSGFFSELYLIYSRGKYDVNATYEKFSQLAVGLSVGIKFRSKLGFVGSIYGGVGRNFLDTKNTPEISPRLGITIGYTF